MTPKPWPIKQLSVASLHLDPKNPRLGRETMGSTPREIIQYLFDHDKAIEVAKSIAGKGYFPNEPLLAIIEANQTVVVEGNRRLAALKALREPSLLSGKHQRQVERLARQFDDISTIAKVSVVIAPSRRATDQLIAGRHIGASVLPWQAVNRAAFILEKLDEGYGDDQLQVQLGFSPAEVQKARKTRAIADMVRALDLPDEVKGKIDNPRTKIFSTIERVFDSAIGRKYLHLELDPATGFRGKTTKPEFIRGLTKVVTDVATGIVSSRTLNTNDDINKYFKAWDPEDLPEKKRGTFTPDDISKNRPTAPPPRTPPVRPKRPKQPCRTVLPKDLRIASGNPRLLDIKRELVKLKREDYPNAGAVLLRVFFELSVIHYLDAVGELSQIVERLEKKEGRKLPFATPTLKQLIPEIEKVALKNLEKPEKIKVQKAIRYDPSAPFTISELHGFVHSSDFPSARDIEQFWQRTEPLFRFMLEEDHEK